jgi:hypothetical protein
MEILSEHSVKTGLEAARNEKEKKDEGNDKKGKPTRPRARPKTGAAEPGKGVKLGMSRAGTT